LNEKKILEYINKLEERSYEENKKLFTDIVTFAKENKQNRNKMIPILSNLLSNEIDEKIRIQAAIFLINIVDKKQQNKSIINTLIQAMKQDPSSFVRTYISGLLIESHLDDETVVDNILSSMREDPDDKVKSNIAMVIAENTSIYNDKLLAILKEDKDYRARILALNALTFYCSPDLGRGCEFEQREFIIPIVLNVLKKDNNLNVKKEAILSLGILQAEESFEILREEFNQNKNKSLRYDLALAILRINGKEGIQLFNEMIKNKELDDYQLSEYNFFKQEIEIEDDIDKLEKSIHHSKIEIIAVNEELKQQEDTEEKTKLLQKIEILQNTITEQNETIKDLKDSFQSFRKAFHELPDKILQNHNDKLLSDNERKVLNDKFLSVLEINCSQYEDESRKRNCRKKKGKILEDFTELFFTSTNGITVYDRNVRFETEEIDLFLQNNIRKPYWGHFKSPNILVECKNWTSKVGADDVKVFRSKINDHKNLIRVGFFIAINGFTKGLNIELIRAEKDDIVIGVITKEDFENFFKTKNTVLNFLESIIFKSIK